MRVSHFNCMCYKESPVFDTNITIKRYFCCRKAILELTHSFSVQETSQTKSFPNTSSFP